MIEITPAHRLAAVKAGRAARDGQEAVEQLRAAFGRVTNADLREDIKASLLAPFARGAGAPTKVSEAQRNRGATVIDRDAPGGAAFESAYRRLWAAVWPKPQAATSTAPTLRVSRKARSAAAALLDACGGDRAAALAALKSL